MIQERYEEGYARAIVSYLALGVDRLVGYGSTLCLLNSTGGRGVLIHLEDRPLSMTWDFAESNPFNPSGAGWITAGRKMKCGLRMRPQIDNSPVAVFHFSATKLDYPDEFLNAVFTGPTIL